MIAAKLFPIAKYSTLNSNVVLTPCSFIEYCRQYDDEYDILPLIRELYLADNNRVQWNDSLSKPKLIDIMQNSYDQLRANGIYSLRAFLKDIRRQMTVNCIKNDSNRALNIYQMILRAHETLSTKLSREPTLDEISAACKEYSFNEYIPEIYDYSAHAIELRNAYLLCAQENKILTGGSFKQYDWLSSLDIDKFLAKHPPDVQIVGANYHDQSCTKLLHKYAQSPRETIIAVMNTSFTGEPGQHWVMLAWIGKDSTLLYYDSCCSDIMPIIRQTIEKIIEDRNVRLVSPFLRSQYSDSECGVYCLACAESIILGTYNEFCAYIVPDEMMMKFRDLIRKEIQL